MTTDYNGAPVEGGTYPAIIWHNFMVQALQILAAENPHQKSTTPSTTTDTTSAPSTDGPRAPSAHRGRDLGRRRRRRRAAGGTERRW